MVPQQSFPHQIHILFSFCFYLHVCFHNPLSPVSAAFTSMGVELFTGAWDTYQGQMLSSLTTIHCHIAFQSRGACRSSVSCMCSFPLAWCCVCPIQVNRTDISSWVGWPAMFKRQHQRQPLALMFFLLPFLRFTLSFDGAGVKIGILFGAKHSVSCPQPHDHLSISLLTLHWKKKLFWPKLRATQLSGHKSRRQFESVTI